MSDDSRRVTRARAASQRLSNDENPEPQARPIDDIEDEDFQEEEEDARLEGGAEVTGGPGGAEAGPGAGPPHGHRVVRIPLGALLAHIAGGVDEDDDDELGAAMHGGLLQALMGGGREQFFERLDDLQYQMALRLSMQEAAREQEQLLGNYDALCNLEDVKVPASPEVVASLKRMHYTDGCCTETRCTICQDDFCSGDPLIKLRCSHTLHEECGSQWLQHHSKKCPMCKHEHDG